MGQRSWARTIDRTYCHNNYGYSKKTKRLQQTALRLRPALRLAGLGVGQSAETWEERRSKLSERQLSGMHGTSRLLFTKNCVQQLVYNMGKCWDTLIDFADEQNL